MRARTLREHVALARGSYAWGDERATSRIDGASYADDASLPSSSAGKLQQHSSRVSIIHALPRDCLMYILASRALSVADLGACDAVCRALHQDCGFSSSVVRDALVLRARAVGELPAREVGAAELLKAEGQRALASLLLTQWSGLPLELNVLTNTGYDGVTFRSWAKPWGYRAEIDGVVLGSFPSAVAAAHAVAQHRWGRS